MNTSQVTITPTFDRFVEEFAESSVVPLHARFMLDSLTPLSLLPAFAPESFVCLLESLGDTPDGSRYSILGLDPKAVFSFDGIKVVEKWTGETPEETESKGVIRQLDEFLRSFHSVYDDSMPLLNGGLIGYVSRDLASANYDATGRETEAPALVHFVVPQTFIIFDAKERHLTVLVSAFSHGGRNAEQAYNEAKQILDAHIGRICVIQTSMLTPIHSNVLPERTTDEPGIELEELASHLTEHAKSAKVSQVYLSRSLSAHTTASPLSIYRIFRMVYPSEYTYLFRINGSHYIGSHELAEAPHSLSFANLLRHVLKDSCFIGMPADAAAEMRRSQGMRYRHNSAVFGYVGFNGRYKLTHGNKEVILKQSSNGYEALFSQAARAYWEGIYSNPKPPLKLLNAGSASVTIRQILLAAEQIS